jgi:N-acetylmuramoyl-L-alanine amidase
MRTLEDFVIVVDDTCRSILGHAIQYHTGNGVWRNVKVQGNISTGFSAAIQQQIELMIYKPDVVSRPNSLWRLRLPRYPNVLFEPVNIQNDETAGHWLFNVKKVAA